MARYVLITMRQYLGVGNMTDINKTDLYVRLTEKQTVKESERIGWTKLYAYSLIAAIGTAIVYIMKEVLTK